MSSVIEPQPQQGSGADVTDEMVASLRADLHGQLLTPGTDGYEQARLVWNGMIDRRPAVIARCADVDDVVAAVNIARENDLRPSVRGGGHNVAGNAVCDAGLVIDLSQMKDIAVDAAAGTVRAAGGVTIGELDEETQRHALAVPLGVVTETGIAGLTLSGGLGWLRRRYGLSIDNLLAADVVTADGRLIHTSAEVEPELFWAIRGGGGNFGVVTSFEFRAHPVGPEVAFAVVFYGREDAAEVLRGFRRWTLEAPDEISAFAILGTIPAEEEVPVEHQGATGVIIAAAHCGAPEVGKTELAPLRQLATPVADLTQITTYLDVQRFFDEDYPAHELRYYWKSRYLADLPDGTIDALVELNDRAPSPHSTFDLWQLGGVASRIAPEATALGDRSAPFLLGIEANWEEASDDAVNLAWAREADAAMADVSTGARYLNFPGFYEEGESVLRETFGANLERLRAAKQAYDPTNLFRLNANIPPTEA